MQKKNKMPEAEKYTGKRVRKLFNGRRVGEFDAMGSVTDETPGWCIVNWDDGEHPYRRPLLCSKKELEIFVDDKQLKLI